MTPAAIIRQAQADGVTLALSPAGSIKAIGSGDAVGRWLPIIRNNKPGIMAELRAANDTAYNTLPDPAAEARRQRVLAMLAANPEARYAVLTDAQSDHEAVIVALAIRGRETRELRILRDRYDGTLLLDLAERHGATLH